MNATTLDFNFKYYHRLAKTITGKSWKFSRLLLQDQDQDQDSGSQDQDQDQDFIFVLEAPRDQDFGLEDYITVIDQPQIHRLTRQIAQYAVVRIVFWTQKAGPKKPR